MQRLEIIALFIISFILSFSQAQMDKTTGQAFHMANQQAERLITVTYQKMPNEVVYEMPVDSCKIFFTVYSAGNTNKGGMHRRNDCEGKDIESLSKYEQLINYIYSDTINAYLIDSVTWISWGRLVESSTEMAIRLAVETKKSSNWDTKRGKVKKGGINNFVRDIANEKDIYKELKDIFTRLQIEIRISAVEKVLIARAKDLPFYEELKSKGIKPNDALPFDCLIWFSVKRK